MSDRIPLPFKQDSGMSFEAYKTRMPLQVTGDDSTQASFDLAKEDAAVELIAQNMSMSELEGQGGKYLNPEEANARYPHMEKAFTEPVHPFVAQLLSDQQDERQKKQAIIAMGPQDMWTKTKALGAGFMAHMTDPLELGAQYLIGWGVGKVVMQSAWAARATMLAEKAQLGESFAATKAGQELVASLAGTKAKDQAIKSGATAAEAWIKGSAVESKVLEGQVMEHFLPRTLYHSVEAGAGNLIQSAAQEAAVAGTNIREQREYDPYQGMQNVAVSTFFGTVLGVGAKELTTRSQAKLSRFIKQTSPEADLAVARSAVGNMAEGIRPNTEPVLKALAQETDVRSEYNYEPLTKASARGKKFFVASDALPNIHPENVRPIGEEWGVNAVKMTDDPYKASAAANRAMADTPGHVFEVSANKLNPIDINQSLPKDAIPAFRKATEGILSERDFLRGSPKTQLTAVWDAIDSGDVSEARIVQLQEDLKKLGYNAFQDDGRSVGGFEHGPHNDLSVFDHSILKEKAVHEPTELRNDPPPQAAEEMTKYRDDVRNRVDIDGHLLDGFDETLKSHEALGLGKDNDFKYVDDEIEAQVEQLKSLEEQGLLDADDAKELEALKNINKEFNIEETLMKAAIHCVSR